jgi:hypothetical protein
METGRKCAAALYAMSASKTNPTITDDMAPERTSEATMNTKATIRRTYTQ